MKTSSFIDTSGTASKQYSMPQQNTARSVPNRRFQSACLVAGSHERSNIADLRSAKQASCMHVLHGKQDAVLQPTRLHGKPVGPSSTLKRDSQAPKARHFESPTHLPRMCSCADATLRRISKLPICRSACGHGFDHLDADFG